MRPRSGPDALRSCRSAATWRGLTALGGRALSLGAPATLVLLAALAGTAFANGYRTGFYSGRTSQGSAISFVVAAGQVTDLHTQISDRCHPGFLEEFLHPYAARISGQGSWYHRAAGVPSQPTVYRGHLAGAGAHGTIDDTTFAANGRHCHGHITFSAGASSPLRIGPATVGPRGTDAVLKLAAPAIYNGSEPEPNTSLALLVYGSNRDCPSTYAAADALARSESGGILGLISDAYVTADYGFALTRGYSHGTFSFDVNSNTLIPTAGGASPFSRVCAMLYKGKPATLTPSRNVALETTHHPLVPGPGIPNTQP